VGTTPFGAGVSVSAAGTGSSADVRGVVAVGTGTQTVPADLAAVVVTLSGGGGLPLGNGLSESKRDDIRSALGRLGIQDSAVSFGGALPFGNEDGSQVTVEVPVAGLPKIATDVVDDIERSRVTSRRRDSVSR
jgi:hypothetical protein